MGVAVIGDAGIVDENVQAVTSEANVGAKLFNLRLIAQISDRGDHFHVMVAGLARHVGESVCINVDKKNIGAFTGERKRNGAADAGCRAGHQRFLATNDAHLVSSFCRNTCKRATNHAVLANNGAY
jgi:hypothetical protein